MAVPFSLPTAVARLALPAVLALAASHTQAASVSCPLVAPAELGVGEAPLTGIRVLAFPAGEKFDESAPPTLVPDQQWQRAGILYQTWEMNSEGAKVVYQVDCQYQGTKRYIRLPAPQVRQCRARWTRDMKVILFHCE